MLSFHMVFSPDVCVSKGTALLKWLCKICKYVVFKRRYCWRKWYITAIISIWRSLWMGPTVAEKPGLSVTIVSGNVRPFDPLFDSNILCYTSFGKKSDRKKFIVVFSLNVWHVLSIFRCVLCNGQTYANDIQLNPIANCERLISGSRLSHHHY